MASLDIGTLVLAGSSIGGVCAIIGGVLTLYHSRSRAAIALVGCFVSGLLLAGGFVGTVFLSSDLRPLAFAVSMTGLFLLPVTWFWFALAYTAELDSRLWQAAGGLASLVGFGGAALVVARPLSNQFWESSGVGNIGSTSFATVQYTGSALYTIFLLVQAAVILLALALVWRGSYQLPSGRRREGMVVVGVIAAVAAVMGSLPLFDPTAHVTSTVGALAAVTAGFIVFGVVIRDGFATTQLYHSEAVLDSIQEAVLVLDSQGSIVDFNRTAELLFLDISDHVGSPLADVYPTLHEAALSNGIYQIPKEGRSHPGGGADDEFFTFRVTATAVRDSGSSTTGQALVLRNITTEHSREQTLETLHTASHQLFTAEAIPDAAEVAIGTALDRTPGGAAALFIKDEKSDSFTIYQGGAVEETTFRDIFSVSGTEKTLDRIMNEGERVLLTESNPSNEAAWLSSDSVPFDWMYQVPIGDKGVFAVGGAGESADSLPNQNFLNILSQSLETTLDRLDREQELKRRGDRIEQQKEQMSFFNGVLRHDILNGVMKMQLGVRRLEDHVDEQGQEYLDSLEAWISDVSSLTQKVRSVSKSVNQDSAETIEVVNIGSILEKRVEKIQKSNDCGSIVLEATGAEAAPASDLVGEVFDNLILNAIDHHHSDPEDVHIHITVETDSESLQVRIADNGPGVPDEDKEAIFEKGHSQGGTGFGLYFVRVMMDRYGGDVWVEDNNPRGSVFVLEFPMETDQSLLSSPV